MREIKNHMVEGDTAPQLTINVVDDPGQGGACHLYQISGFSTLSNSSDPFVALYGKPAEHSTILFQNGPIKSFGVNGVTETALLAILIDRLVSFQAGPFSCKENEAELNGLRTALFWAQYRTRDRIARGVEGKNEK